jgi:NAD(P)-dependent dehydrogenase (short-subunit alcohol dehydrogenase family)
MSGATCANQASPLGGSGAVIDRRRRDLERRWANGDRASPAQLPFGLMTERPPTGRFPAAIVTGAAGAIGTETVVALAMHGHRVAATDLVAADRRALARAIDDAGVRDRVQIFTLDVTDSAMAGRTVDDILAWTGGALDVLVNNAGVRSAGLFTHTPWDAQRAMFEVNYFGVCNVTRAVLPTMRRRGRGHVIVVSSVGALAGLPGLAGYCASKSAVEGWAESVAMEVRPFGIRFTLIEPASMRSGIWQSGAFHVDHDAPDHAIGERLELLDTQAASKAGDPRSVAAAIVRSARIGERWTPTRVPVGATAVVRHAARGIVPPVAQRAVLRRALSLPAPSPCPPMQPGTPVLVTGASSGLGRDLVVELHDRGWRVFATVRDHAKARALRAHIGRRNIEIVTMVQDDEDSVRRALADVAEQTGGVLGAVVANAGLKVTGPFEELSEQSLRTMIDVNVLGTWFVVRGAIDLLRANSGGRIVVVGSSSGFTGMPGWSGYAASKFALEAWAEAVAYELESEAIRITMVEPGTFRSEIYREGSVAPAGDGPYAHLAAAIAEREQLALGRAGGAEPVVARVAEVLASAHPPARAPVGRGAQARLLVRGIVPGSLLQRMLTVR